MSEERSKISLRSGKRKAKPTISAPRQISSPILQDGSNTAVAPGLSGATSEPPMRPRLRPPPMAGGKVLFGQLQ
ncbi:Exocyst complex component EXO84 [Beauveria bassiana]|uniref:Exocyst complex component EXO84 n=1 Tax=Beauveria bassiana TaxID=176275 RepID=A0A2N6NG40_BEABA|nr:Exocyst complex component EXO84 [Beauveria bassiana]